MVPDPIDTTYIYGNFEDDNNNSLQAQTNEMGAAALDEGQPDSAVVIVSTIPVSMMIMMMLMI